MTHSNPLDIDEFLEPDEIAQYIAVPLEKAETPDDALHGLVFAVGNHFCLTLQSKEEALAALDDLYELTKIHINDLDENNICAWHPI
jgi:hypothetical protein